MRKATESTLVGSVMGAVCLLAVMGSGFAHGNTFVAGSTDITGTSAYDDGQVPGSGAEVLLTNGIVHVTYGTPGWTKLNEFGKVLGKGPRGARLEITVPGGETAELTTPVTGQGGETYFAWRYGGILKKGEGTLVLRGSGTDFFSPIDVDEGLVRVVPAAGGNYQLGAVTVAAGATVDLQKGSCSAMLVHGFFGEGLVTNSVSTSLTLRFHNNADEPGDFSGVIGGQINASMMDVGAQILRNKSNTLTGVNPDASYLGVTAIGAGSAPSSIGTAAPWLLGGALEYLGTGEKCTRTFWLSATQGYFTLAAGPNGDFEYAGDLSLPGDKPKCQCVTLAGEGTGAVYSGSTPADWTYGGQLASLCFTKDGPGKWRFAVNGNRRHSGSLAVRNGTLAFDTIEEAGLVSSLGTGTNRTDCYGGTYDPSRGGKPYAIMLGAQDQGATVVLEFTGTSSQTCCTRPILLDGDGTIRNNGAAAIRWAGISPDAGTRTLTLDGSSSAANEIADVTDGTLGGSVSVVKEGTGTWTLGGDSTFSGDLEVKAGRLVVRKPSSSQYTWYRWSWMQTEGDNGFWAANRPAVVEMMLADADDVRHATGLTAGTDYASLQPGETAPGSCYGYGSGDITKLFDMTSTEYSPTFRYPGGASFPVCALSTSDPSSWPSVVLRLTNGTPEIVQWDYAIKFKLGSGNGIGLSASKLEGSVDGLHWEELDRHTYADTKMVNSWDNVFAGSSWENGYSWPKHTGGRTIAGRSSRTYSALSAVRSVKVASGAVLEAEGDVSLANLTVGVSGAGTVRGFTFAANGVLDVANLSRSQATVLPVTFDAVKNLGNMASWTLKVNGVENRAKMRIVVANGSVSIVPAGTMVIVR